MEIFFYLIAILAAVAISVMVTHVLPFSLDKRLNPWLMFGAALLALVLPHLLVFALAMTVPVSLICNFTGVRLQGHEPVQIPVHKIVEVASKLKPPPKAEVKEFLTKEFPDPSGVDKYVPEL